MLSQGQGQPAGKAYTTSRSGQVCRVEETVPRISLTTTHERSLRQAKRNDVNSCEGRQLLNECTAIGSSHAFGLHDPDDDHNVDGGMDLVANVPDEIEDRFARVDHGVHEDQSQLSIHMMHLDVSGILCVDEHGVREGIVDTEAMGSPPRMRATMVVFFSCRSW